MEKITIGNKKTSVRTTGQELATLEKVASQATSSKEQPRQVFDLSIFEVVEGKVNLTRIGQYFKKDVNTWKKSKKVQEFVRKLDEISGCQNLQTRLGDGEQGTFATEKVALKFAEYISTDFEVWANDKLHTLLQTGKVELQPQPKPTLAINADFLEQVAKKMRELEEAKQRVIEETKPAVEFTHQVQNSINSVTVADFAKAMGSGQIRFYTWLREKGYLMSHPKNRPYQNYIDSGYFKVIEKTFTDQSTGETRTYFQTLITGKGQTYLAARWEKQQLALN